MPARVGLIGHPISHSISPAFQQAAFDAIGFDARYEAWDVAPDALPRAVERLRSAALLGANVTVPHKVELLRLADRPDALGPPQIRGRVEFDQVQFGYVDGEPVLNDLSFQVEGRVQFTGHHPDRRRRRSRVKPRRNHLWTIRARLINGVILISRQIAEGFSRL